MKLNEKEYVLGNDRAELERLGLWERAGFRRGRRILDVGCGPGFATVDLERMLMGESGFDGAYARWVLCFVRQPAAVLKQVAQRLKRSGVFVIQDYYAYENIIIAPESARSPDAFFTSPPMVEIIAVKE